MHDAGGCDDLVGGVTVEIQSFDRTADIERQWPGLNARQRSRQLRVIQVNLDPAQFREFGDLPKDDCGNAPGIIGEQAPLESR